MAATASGRGKFKESNLDAIHLSCDIHSCGHELLSGACQMIISEEIWT